MAAEMVNILTSELVGIAMRTLTRTLEDHGHTAFPVNADMIMVDTQHRAAHSLEKVVQIGAAEVGAKLSMQTVAFKIARVQPAPSDETQSRVEWRRSDAGD